MRMTVEDLMRELEDKPAKALVTFQTGVLDRGEPIIIHDVQRVENFGHNVVVVIGR